MLKLRGHQHQGFALPMALIMGLIMMTLMTASLISAESNRNSSKARQSSGTSSIMSDSAIARVLVELAKPENSELLTRNYDPTNLTTGNIYLGNDHIVNSGDETGIALDEWSGYDRSSLPCYQERGIGAPTLTSRLSGTIGSQGTYQLLAYRYHPSSKTGTVLISGTVKNITSYVVLTISIEPNLDHFPGIGVFADSLASGGGVVGLRGRDIIGDKANVYFVPRNSADTSLTGSSNPGDPDRASYLNAIWSSASDGASTDSVGGSLIACNLDINIPQGITGTNLGNITTNQTIQGVGGTTQTSYRVDGINLTGTDVLTIDTTGGPVVIEMGNSNFPSSTFTLRDQSKIVNVRTDGQPPKVGDVRILIRKDMRVELFDQSCIEQVFIYSFQDEVILRTDGPGCSSGKNTNFEGVIWAEAIFSAKNHDSNRNVNYLGLVGGYQDTMVVPDVSSGIAVPDDVSSLVDLLQYTDFPLSYRYKEILAWQRVYL